MKCRVVFFGAGDRLIHSSSTVLSGAWFDANAIKENVSHSENVVLLFEDGHAEVRWPERPGWSHYDSLDAALISAELRGYRCEKQNN